MIEYQEKEQALVSSIAENESDIKKLLEVNSKLERTLKKLYENSMENWKGTFFSFFGISAIVALVVSIGTLLPILYKYGLITTSMYQGEDPNVWGLIICIMVVLMIGPNLLFYRIWFRKREQWFMEVQEYKDEKNKIERDLAVLRQSKKELEKRLDICRIEITDVEKEIKESEANIEKINEYEMTIDSRMNKKISI